MASALRSSILRHVRPPATQNQNLVALNSKLITTVRSFSSHGDDHLDKEEVISRVLDDVKSFPKVDPSKEQICRSVTPREGFDETLRVGAYLKQMIDQVFVS